MIITVEDLQKLRHVEFRNAETLGRNTITGVSTDSRKVTAGDLFVALKGENFDGHAFVRTAAAQGAVAGVVSASTRIDAPPTFPLLVVEDSSRTLGDIAHLIRARFDMPVIAIAGSNGKTTTKEMVAKVLSARYRVLSTEGNLNNHIGVPLTIFRMQKAHDIAVVEIGTNHPGELAYLCCVLEPTHGLITNIGKEHLEFFKNADGVSEEEGALFASLKRTKKSRAFVNADDARVVAQSSGLRRRLRYGFAAREVDVRGRILGYDERGCARLRVTSGKRKTPLTAQLQVPGEPNAANALAAAAVGIAFGVPQPKIRSALEVFSSASKRMEVMNIEGVTVLNDTYNANPDSTSAALRTLAASQGTGKRVAVLADMLELGEHAEEEHARIGQEVTNLGLHYLLTYGKLSKYIHDAARVQFAVHYVQKNMLAEYLAELVSPGDVVLIKGSRGMKMEDVVTFLEQRLRSRNVR